MTLPAVTDPAVVERLLRESDVPATDVRVSWARDEAPASTFAAIEFRVDGATHRGYLRAHPGDRAAVIAAKWARLRRIDGPIGPGVRLLHDRRVALFLFPNDAGLRDLRWASDVKKLKRTLSEAPEIRGRGLHVSGKQSGFTVLRYKPERRYILRGSLALRTAANEGNERLEAVIRFFPDDRGAGTEVVTRALRTGDAVEHVPRPIATFMDGRLFVEEAVRGTPITDAVRRGTADAGAVASCLQAVHETDAELPGDRSAAALLSSLRADVDGLGAGAARVLDRLDRNRPGHDPRAVVHGDVHPAQILADEDRLWLVDWERAGMGDPALDLGRLSAELSVLAFDNPEEAAAIEAFRCEVVERYCARTRVSVARISFYASAALLGLAAVPIRRGEPDGASRAARIVTLAETEACRWKPSWRVLYPRASGGWSVRLGDERHGSFLPSDTNGVHPVEPAQDPALPALAPLLRDGRLVSYRAGRRAVVHDPARDRWIKVLPARKAGRVRDRLEALHACFGEKDPPHPAFPVIDPGVDGAGLIGLRPIVGPSLRDLLSSRAETALHLEVVARGLAAFHGAPGAEAFPAVRWPNLPAWIEYAAAVDPVLALRLRSVFDEHVGVLHAPIADAPTFAHGDLHDANILLAEDRIALIDADGVGRGAASEDVGNLVAHFVLAALRADRDPAAGRHDRDALVRAYREAGGHVEHAEVLEAGARALFRLTVVYALRASWRETAETLLFEAEDWSREACAAH